MNPVRPTIAVFLFVGAVMPAVCLSQDVYLKEMPKGGDIPFGKVVYVDDGQCPKGEVKEVRGGSQVKGIARQVRCVKSAVASSEFDGRYSGRALASRNRGRGVSATRSRPRDRPAATVLHAATSHAPSAASP